MKKFNVGILGLGGMGQMMHADMSVHRKFSVSVVWDANKKVLEEHKISYPNVRIADSALDLINDPSIQLLYVATPPKFHCKYLTYAIEAKVPILCEKPLGIDLSESKEIVELVKGSFLPNIINFNHGNSLACLYVEKQLNDGSLGNIFGVDTFIHLSQWPREFQKKAKWLAGREQGGFTREMLSHWLYLTRRLFGEGVILNSNITYPNDSVSSETRLLSDLDFDGIPMSIIACAGGKGPEGTEYTIWGEKKSFRFHSGGGLSVSVSDDWVDVFCQLDDIGVIDRQRGLDGVVSKLTGNLCQMPNLSDGLAVQSIVETILGSRKPVK
jgi:predicted dehydrogenase